MRTAELLARLVVLVHLAYLGFVLLGGFLVARDVRWGWPHLAAVTWGVIGTITASPCPVTALEKSLWQLSGSTPYDGPFITHYLAGTLYPASAQDQVWRLCVVTVAASYVVVLVARWPHRPLGLVPLPAGPGLPAAISGQDAGQPTGGVDAHTDGSDVRGVHAGGEPEPADARRRPPAVPSPGGGRPHLRA
jgi:hypothetical protein